MKKTIIILPSDPDSINYEIIKKSLFFFNNKNKNRYLFIGCKKEILKYLNIKKIEFDFIDIKMNKNIKKYLKKCFEQAFKLLIKNKAHGLINLPLNKKNLPLGYVGFTEYISDYFKIKNKESMLLFNNKFSVCPNTTHVRLSKVSHLINKKVILKNIYNINSFYKKIIGIKKPHIGIMGFNPHNGIDFKGSTEEKTIIIPSIKKAKKNNIKISGPLSPDAAFNKIFTNKINCLIGNYHDQVLPLFKYINKFKAINITLGLPFLRVSLDHGTATDIKNKNKANPESFLYALNFFEKYFKKI